MSRYLIVNRYSVLLGIIFAAVMALAACDEESRIGTMRAPRAADSAATSTATEVTPSGLTTPTALPTIAIPPTRTPAATPTRRPATRTPTATPTAVPVSTPVVEAQTQATLTPTPQPDGPPDAQAGLGSATSTSSGMEGEPESATPTIILAEPAPSPVPIQEIRLSGVRTSTNRPGQIQFVFSLRDRDGRSLDIPSEVVSSATRIYEIAVAAEVDPAAAAEDGAAEGGSGEAGAAEGGEGSGGAVEVPTGDGEGTASAAEEGGEEAEVWSEIDYAETNVFVRTADLFQQEVVFVLDFSSSMADSKLPDGTPGSQAMTEAFFKAMDSLPESQRIGVVEFHDRNQEPAVLSELKVDREAIRASVSAFATSPFDAGSTRVWDGIERAAALFTASEVNPSVVKSVVFITDGRDTSSNLSTEDVQSGANLRLHSALRRRSG